MCVCASDTGDLFNEAVAIIEKKKFDKQKEYVQEQTTAQVRRNSSECEQFMRETWMRAMNWCGVKVRSMFDAILNQPDDPTQHHSSMSLSGFDRLGDVKDVRKFFGSIDSGWMVWY